MLLPWIGVWPQAIAFALLHVGPGRRFAPWTASALVVGVGLGYVAVATDNLGAPIVAHFTINLLNLRYITRVDLEEPDDRPALVVPGASVRDLEGAEPDPRFSFANERTFLAWLRTALALISGGVALDVIDLPLADGVQELLAIVLVLLGLVCSLASWVRWARAERAMRRNDPLPSSPFAAVLAAGLVTCAIALLLSR
jgi:putative membrane protein